MTITRPDITGTKPPPNRLGVPMLPVDWRAEDEQEVSVKPKVMVIAPGHHYSTKDVYDSVVNGLAACDVDVLPFPYHDYLSLLQPLEDFWSEDPAASAKIADLAANAAFPRAMAFRPDLLLFVTGYVFPQPASLLLGQYTRTAVWLTESPYQWRTEWVAQGNFRWAFTNERLTVDWIKEQRKDDGHPHPDAVHYLPHAYDPERHYPRDAVDERYRSDVCFVGSPFPERQRMFREADWSGIKMVTRGLWTKLDVESAKHPETGLVGNDEAHLFYAGAKVNINHHRTIQFYGGEDEISPEQAESLNPRTYELAAARCFQVCDDSRPELAEIFGDSIPTYRHNDGRDLERVAHYWLKRPDERAAKAQEAYERVREHSIQHRMRFLLDTCLGGDRGA